MAEGFGFELDREVTNLGGWNKKEKKSDRVPIRQ